MARSARPGTQENRAIDLGIADPQLARKLVTQLADDLQDPSCPVEIRSPRPNLARWSDQTVAWHESFVTNGPTEGTNKLIKRIKRFGFGFRNFAHYRIRVVLGERPRWDLLPTAFPSKSNEPLSCRRYSVADDVHGDVVNDFGRASAMIDVRSDTSCVPQKRTGYAPGGGDRCRFEPHDDARPTQVRAAARHQRPAPGGIPRHAWSRVRRS